jgi:hypothetical protein
VQKRKATKTKKPSLTQKHLLKENLVSKSKLIILTLSIATVANGEATLTGAVRDQAELHGLLDRVFDLNLTLLEVKRIAAASE